VLELSPSSTNALKPEHCLRQCLNVLAHYPETGQALKDSDNVQLHRTNLLGFLANYGYAMLGVPLPLVSPPADVLPCSLAMWQGRVQIFPEVLLEDTPTGQRWEHSERSAIAIQAWLFRVEVWRVCAAVHNVRAGTERHGRMMKQVRSPYSPE
jgi:hypothetical protein